MIARIWHGVTNINDVDTYTDYLNRTGLPDYRATPGNLGAYLLCRREDDRAHFVTVSFWESEQAIRAFAGDDIEKAHYYPEDTQFLLELEPLVKHYEVLSGVGESSR